MTAPRQVSGAMSGGKARSGSGSFTRRRWPQRTTTASRCGCAVPTGRRRKARSSPTSRMCASGCYARTASQATSRRTWRGKTGTRTSPVAACTAPTARSSPFGPTGTVAHLGRFRPRLTSWSSAPRGSSRVTGCSASRAAAMPSPTPGQGSAWSCCSAPKSLRPTGSAMAAVWRAIAVERPPRSPPTPGSTPFPSPQCWARCRTQRFTHGRSRATRRPSMGELITERITANARELKLLGLAETADELVDRAETAKLGYREFLDLVLEAEIGVLEGRRYSSRLKMSGLPHHKTLDEFDTSFQPELDPKRLAELRSLRFIERHVCALILGPPGVGKSHIAVGIAMEALKAGYLVRYTTLDDLVRDLRQADRLGTLRHNLSHYPRPHLLICDEVGYLPLEQADANRF